MLGRWTAGLGIRWHQIGGGLFMMTTAASLVSAPGWGPDGGAASFGGGTSTFRTTSANVRFHLSAPEKPERQQVSHLVFVAIAGRLGRPSWGGIW